MTEIASIDWFGRWGTSVFSENTAIFIFYNYSLDIMVESAYIDLNSIQVTKGPRSWPVKGSKFSIRDFKKIVVGLGIFPLDWFVADNFVADLLEEEITVSYCSFLFFFIVIFKVNCVWTV